MGSHLPVGIPSGPNLAVCDHIPAVDQDPLFNGWVNPIPQWWSLGALQYPILGAPNSPVSNEFSHFYQRISLDVITVGAELFPEENVYPSPILFTELSLDEAFALVQRGRSVHEILTTSDSIQRVFAGHRSVVESYPTTDSATALKFKAPQHSMVYPEVHPINET